jgi:hypothetical protein
MANPLTSVREGEPAELVAGDTLKWRRADLAADYPPATWTLHYSARAVAGAVAVELAGVADTDGAHLVTVTAAASAKWAAGEYSWSAYLTNGAGERVTIGRGKWTVLADLTAAPASFDDRTGARRTLDAIDALLQRRAGADVQSWTIQTAGGGQQTLGKMTWPELLAARKYFAALVEAEDRKAKIASGKPVGLIGLRF